MADCTYPKCQQTAIPGCQGLCRDLSVNRRATDGQRAGVPEGWRISMDEEGISIESPSGDGCYLWDIDQRNSDALRPNHYREVFRQLCQSLLATAPTPPDGDAERESAYELWYRLRNPLTPFGSLVRSLRIVADALLGDMAYDLQTTAATLSAYECGRKPIPPELPRHAAEFFARRGITGTLPALTAAMAASKGEK